MPLIDPFNRTIDYLRVSVTDRCNFRCVYCMPEEGAPIAPKSEILTYEEIYRLLRIASSLGISKVRLTGGEPLVRKDILQLVETIGAIKEIKDLSLTTNGILLRRMATDLKTAGLDRVNISLDTLNEDRFVAIARRGNLKDVLDGIQASVDAGLGPIKLNMVVMRGFNEDEVADFAKLTVEQPFHVRFIELMPINWSAGDDEMGQFYALAGRSSGTSVPISLFANSEHSGFGATVQMGTGAAAAGMLSAPQMRRSFVSSKESKDRIESVFGPLEPAEVITNGPARTFKVSGGSGSVGFISQITNDHCANCNRLRLTADGFLRPCLMADGEVELRKTLRTGGSDEEIANLFRATVFHKPYEHRLEDGMAPSGRNMSQLGG